MPATLVERLGAGETSWPEGALREAGLLLGLDIDNRRLIRIGHCAIVALPSHGLVARIARPGEGAERPEAEMTFARFLHRRGLPVVPPADEITARPIETRGGAVAFWPLLKSTGQEIDWPALGRTLRWIHSLTPPDRMLSLWDPVGRVEARLERYRSGPRPRAEYVRLVSEACSWARCTIGRSVATTAGIVHGDPTNVIMTAAGLVLIDFDLCGLGPPFWDVASVAVRHRRFGLSRGDLEGFYAAYGFAPAARGAFEDLVRLREVLDCSFALGAIGAKESAADQELEIRMRALRDPADRSGWTPLDCFPEAE